MITRVADFAKDSSSMLKKNELMQDYFAVQAKTADHIDQSKVAKSLEGQKAYVEKDKEKEGQSGQKRGSKKQNDGNENVSGAINDFMPDSNCTIDIKI
jgi:hypothetical protein